MASQTVTSAFTTAGSATRTGSDANWADVANVLVSNNTRASVILGDNEQSNFVTVQALATVPPARGKVLTEIRLKIERQQVAGGDVSDGEIFAIIGGVVQAIDYSGADPYLESNDEVHTITIDAAALATAGITLGTLRSATFGFAVSADALGTGSTGSIDYIGIEYDVTTGNKKKDMDTMQHVKSGGLKPLPGRKAIPTVSSSTAIFADAPEGTVMVSVTVLDQDLWIAWNPLHDANGKAIVEQPLAVASAGNANKYLAGDTYDFPITRAYLQAARAIQGGATCTGTIQYWGKA